MDDVWTTSTIASTSIAGMLNATIYSKFAHYVTGMQSFCLFVITLHRQDTGEARIQMVPDVACAEVLSMKDYNRFG